MVLVGILVTIHEFGHFIVARMCKVHVQRFSIGMGPVFYKRNDKHGTEFALSAIPLGGYVSMITNKLIELEPEVKDQLTEEQIQNTFDSKPKWQRASIMFAGPLANFILSIFIFTLICFSDLFLFLAFVFVSVVLCDARKSFKKHNPISSGSSAKNIRISLNRNIFFFRHTFF